MSTAERTLPTPVYAVVGAGDIVVQETKDAIDRLRNRAETAQARLVETGTKISELPTDLDVEELRSKLNKDELLKLAGPYLETATGFYSSLAERGEGAVERLRSTTRVQENLDRVGKAYNDAVDRTEGAIGAVSSQTRAAGEKAAALAGRTAGKVGDVAVAIEEAGDKALSDSKVAVSKVVDAAAAVEEAGDKVKADADTAASKIDGAAGTVEAKARTAKSSPAKRISAAKAPAKKATARKAPARKAAPKTEK